MFIGKHIFIIFLGLFVIRNFRSAVLKVGGITPLGASLRGKGVIKAKGKMGEITQRGQERSTTNQSMS